MPISNPDRPYPAQDRRPDPPRPALEALRRRVLRSLAGPTPVSLAEIPRRRPFTRVQIDGVVRKLAEEGLVERVVEASSPGPITYRATAAGRAMLLTRDSAPPRNDAAA